MGQVTTLSTSTQTTLALSGSRTRTRSLGSPGSSGRWGRASSRTISAVSVGTGSDGTGGSGTGGSGTPGTDGRGTGRPGDGLLGAGAGAGLGCADGFGEGEGEGDGFRLDGADDGFAEELGVGRALDEAAGRGAGEPAYANPEPSGVAEPLPAGRARSGERAHRDHGHAAAVRVGDGQDRADVGVGLVVAHHGLVGGTRLAQVRATRAQQDAGTRHGVGEALRVGDTVTVAVASGQLPRGRDELHGPDGTVVDGVPVEGAAVGVGDPARCRSSR